MRPYHLLKRPKPLRNSFAYWKEQWKCRNGHSDTVAQHCRNLMPFGRGAKRQNRHYLQGGFAWCYEGRVEEGASAGERVAVKVIPKHRLVHQRHVEKVRSHFDCPSETVGKRAKI